MIRRVRTTLAAASLMGALATGAALAQEKPAGPSEDLRSELKAYPHKVVFETNRDGNWELYLVNADGSAPVNLTRTPDVGELYPKPSPDGTKIVFVADLGKDPDMVRNVYVMNSDGTNRVKVADNAREPCWSPDGKLIAYAKGEYAKYTVSDFATKGIFIYDLATGATRQHPNAKIEHLYTLNWTAGGKWFVSTVHGGMGFSHAILAIEADGNRVFDLKLGGCRPNVRSDGKKVAWGHGDFCAGTADLDLSGPTPKATHIVDVVESKEPVETYHVTWSPEGKYLTFTSGPKKSKKSLKPGLPEFPGVEAPGWNVCVADASKRNRWVQLTTDGKSNKQPSWVVVKEGSAK
jgi:Tol biopolymer transport system component